MIFKQKRRSGSISTQLMMFLIFVVFPASWTVFAPVTRIKLERNDQTITATVRRCMYFFVHYYSQQLRDVSNVRVETYKGEKQGYNAHLSEDQNRPDRRSYAEVNSIERARSSWKDEFFRRIREEQLNRVALHKGFLHEDLTKTATCEYL